MSSNAPNNNNKQSIPQLPSSNLKIGEYVKKAFKRLEKSGYVFSEEDLDALVSPEKSRLILGLTSRSHAVAILKKYDPNEETPHIVEGFTRYYAPKPNNRTKGYLLSFNDSAFLLSKEWREGYRDSFNKWYSDLK